MHAIAKQYGVYIVGGDTTRSNAGLVITVTLTGEVEPERVALRSAAQPGYTLLVTGSLGGSIAGHHLRFEPRVQEARFLVERYSPMAMIDVSAYMEAYLDKKVSDGTLTQEQADRFLNMKKDMSRSPGSRMKNGDFRKRAPRKPEDSDDVETEPEA